MHTMERGKKYYVTYLTKGVHRKPHHFVGIYCGANDHGLVFSLRPASGTSHVSEESIITYKETTEPAGIRD